MKKQVRYLWVLRHAKAEIEPPQGGGDHERRLASRGRRDSRALGRRLAESGDRLGMPKSSLPDLALCSTAARTKETIELVAAAMANPPPITYLSALYVASPEEVIGQVTKNADRARSVLIVGHNPTAQKLVFLMTGSKTFPSSKLGRRRHRDSPELPTCSVAVFRLVDQQWEDAITGSAEPLGLFFPPF